MVANEAISEIWNKCFLEINLPDIKVIHKVRKRRHRNPLCLVTCLGDEISKNSEKKYTGLQLGMKLRFAQLSLALSFFFPKAFNQSLMLLLCVL
jgi:hypothetical protein